MYDTSGNAMSWTIYDKRHTHTSKPTNLKASATTTTITVNATFPTDSSASKHAFSIDGGTTWKDYTPSSEGYKFTGLNANTSYTIKARTYCSCGETYDSDSITIKTHIRNPDTPIFEGATATSITVKSPASPGAIKHWIGISTDNVTFTDVWPDAEIFEITGLKANTTYYIKCASYCSYDDWHYSNTITAKTCIAKPADISVYFTTYKTIKVNVTGWDYITIDGGTNWHAINGASTYTFNNRTHGNTYKIKCKKTCGNHKETDDHVGTYISNELSVTTWNITIEKAGKTTRSLTFKATHTAGTKGSNGYGSDKLILYRLYDNDGGYQDKTGSSGTGVTFDKLTHNKKYTCRVATQDVSYVSGNFEYYVDLDYTTKQLALNHSSTEEHQHSIITKWLGKIDGVIYNQGVTGNELSFRIECKAKKSTSTDVYNDPYQVSGVIVGSNGNNSHTTTDIDKQGGYIVNTSGSLTWYHCEYEITGYISDGWNEVPRTITAHTTFPYSWIYDTANKEWRKVRPYIYTGKDNKNNGWEPAPAFIYNGTTFKESNGEE